MLVEKQSLAIRGVAALCLVLTPATISAFTFTVDRPDDEPSATPCDAVVENDCSLRGAILAANLAKGLDTILLPPDRYNLTVVGSDEDAAARGDLDLLADIVIEGAGEGSTIIDAGGEFGLGDRVFHVHQGVNATILKVTIQGGRGAFIGGGIRNDGTTTLVDSTITNNTSTGAGTGGGIMNHIDATFLLRNSTVQDNEARQGAGIHNSGMMVIEGSSIIENGLAGETVFGGGIRNSTVLEVRNTWISGNRAVLGGGLFLYDFSTTTIRNSEIINNQADQEGGGINVRDGRLTLTGSTLSGNSVAALGLGGGIINEDMTEIVNSTISGNTVGGGTSGSGGGIYNEIGATVEMSHVTLVDNRSFAGLALANLGSTTVSNTVLHAPGLSVLPCSGDPVTSLGGNIESADPFLMNPGPDSCGLDQPSDQVEVDVAELNLGPLADNGGPTPTRSLLVGSFAINAGISSECELLDQRGWFRTDGLCDVGAFEVGAVEPGMIFIDGFESGNTFTWSASVP